MKAMMTEKQMRRHIKEEDKEKAKMKKEHKKGLVFRKEKSK